MNDAGYTDPKIREACEKSYRACDICASSVLPGISKKVKKVSLTHVNQAFNEEMQADFCVVYVGSNTFEMLNIVDVRTGYGERIMAPKRDAGTMKQQLETGWLCRYGSPKEFIADPEFCRPIV